MEDLKAGDYISYIHPAFKDKNVIERIVNIIINKDKIEINLENDQKFTCLSDRICKMESDNNGGYIKGNSYYRPISQFNLINSHINIKSFEALMKEETRKDVDMIEQTTGIRINRVKSVDLSKSQSISPAKSPKSKIINSIMKSSPKSSISKEHIDVSKSKSPKSNKSSPKSNISSPKHVSTKVIKKSSLSTSNTYSPSPTRISIRSSSDIISPYNSNIQSNINNKNNKRKNEFEDDNDEIAV